MERFWKDCRMSNNVFFYHGTSAKQISFILEVKAEIEYWKLIHIILKAIKDVTFQFILEL